MPSLATVLTASTIIFSSLAAAKVCPPQGAVLPAPRAPASNLAVKKAAEGLKATLDKRLESFQASGISIGVKSIHEDEPLFEYNLTPEVAEDIGTDKIDSDSIFRVGSLSKLVPVLGVLQLNGVNLDDSILEYIPELQGDSEDDELTATQWEDVTIRSLMSHMSGMATDTVFDLSLLRTANWTDMGLPKLDPTEGLTCAGIPGTQPCGLDDLVSQLSKSPPTFSPYTTPSYSNSASPLLARVVEKVTGKKFNDAVQDTIFDVAGMKSTSFDGPVDAFEKNGFVPKGDPLWNSTLGVYESAGGMWSSSNDVLSFGSAILSNDLLSKRKTRAWLQPDAFVSSFGQAVGGPWEIIRGDKLTSDNRIIDVYTKSGDMSLYHANLALVPEYDLVISVLTGGLEVSKDPFARSRLLSAAVSAFVPAMEQAAREQASSKDGQAGRYADNKTDSTLVLELDDGPGLRLTEFTVRGYDVLKNIDEFKLSTGSAGSASLKRRQEDEAPVGEARVYPAQRSNKNQSAWRAVFTAPMKEEDVAQLEKDSFYSDPSCITWFGIDRSRYNFESITEFVFETCGDGKVQAVSSPAFDVRFKKVGQ